MYNTIHETSRQSRFDARYWMLGAGALGRPIGMVQGGKREEGSGWGTCVYLWRIHVDIWQNQYNIVKLKNKIKKCEFLKNSFLHIFTCTGPAHYMGTQWVNNACFSNERVNEYILFSMDFNLNSAISQFFIMSFYFICIYLYLLYLLCYAMLSRFSRV